MSRRIKRSSFLPWVALTAFGLMGCFGKSVSTPANPTTDAPEPSSLFDDVTAVSGIDFTYRNGQEAGHFAILESLGGGVGLLDFDRDSLLDIFLPGGGYYDGPDRRQIQGHPSRLYRNLGNGKFRDVTAAVGLDRPLFYTHGCAVADYDNDGWPDLAVTGWGRLALYHNESAPGGGRRFAEVSRQAGLTDDRWSTSAAWADINGDGFADLYVCHYVNWSFANNPPCPGYTSGVARDVCPPKQFAGLPDVLYLNNGDGTFRDVSTAVGLRQDTESANKGLGVLAADLDDDGRVDVYVANDTTDNFLYLNRTEKGGAVKFEELGLARGVAVDENGSPNGSMGVAAADYDGSGHLSLFVTNYQHESHALYRNRGGAVFSYASRATGISALGLTFVGFGTGFLDFDRDGAEDLFLSNGHVVRHPPPPGELRQRAVLFRNVARGESGSVRIRFEDVGAAAGPYFRDRHCGRGVALGDLDNDGCTDLVISHLNEPVALLRNVSTDGNHWLGVELVGRPYRDAVGARVTLEVAGRTLTRAVQGGGSYLSSGDRRLLFGLGPAAQVGRLTVHWPSGKVQSWDGLAGDRYWRLTEGEAAAARP